MCSAHIAKIFSDQAEKLGGSNHINRYFLLLRPMRNSAIVTNRHFVQLMPEYPPSFAGNMRQDAVALCDKVCCYILYRDVMLRVGLQDYLPEPDSQFAVVMEIIY